MHITIFGYLCRDRNTLPDEQTTEMVGGKGLFTSVAVAQTGVQTDLITWLPPEDEELLSSLQPYPITYHVIPIPTGTVNSNTHTGDATIATTRIDPYSITPADLDPSMELAIQDSQIVHLAPDLQEKISLAAIQHLSDILGIKVSADIGKYYRTLRPDGQLIPKFPWPEQVQYLRYFDTVFMSKEDIAPMLTKGESLLSIARELAEQGPNEVIITRGSEGSFIYHRETNEAYDIPSYPPKKIVDPTGAGDTYIGAYLGHRLQTDDIHASGKFAAMAASLKLNYVGPLREVAETIEERLKEREAEL